MVFLLRVLVSSAPLSAGGTAAVQLLQAAASWSRCLGVQPPAAALSSAAVTRQSAFGLRQPCLQTRQQASNSFDKRRHTATDVTVSDKLSKILLRTLLSDILFVSEFKK